MRALGIFNVCYGAVGLLCSILLLTVLETDLMPDAALATAAAASATTVVAGIALVVFGDRLKKKARAMAARAWSRLRGTTELRHDRNLNDGAKRP